MLSIEAERKRISIKNQEEKSAIGCVISLLGNLHVDYGLQRGSPALLAPAKLESMMVKIPLSGALNKAADVLLY